MPPSIRPDHPFQRPHRPESLQRLAIGPIFLEIPSDVRDVMMIDVNPGARGLAALAVTSLALLPAMVSAQRIPEEYTNLKILPEGIQRNELVGIMRGFAIGLGVRCSFCHTQTDSTLPTTTSPPTKKPPNTRRG